MKAKRRHELQTNDLAAWLGKWLNRASEATSQAKRNSVVMIVFWGVLAAAVVWLGYRVYNAYQSGASAEAWTDLFINADRGDAVALAELAEREGTRPVGLWAAQTAGDLELAQGTWLLHRDRAQAAQSLAEAQRQYERALAAKDKDALLYERAVFGLAQAHEALAVAGPADQYTEHLDKARRYYREVAERGEASPLAEEAKKRLEHMERLIDEDFYAWLAEHQPTPPPEQSSSATEPGAPDLGSLPDEPDIQVPGGEEPEGAEGAEETNHEGGEGG